jgi:hypothetical protein
MSSNLVNHRAMTRLGVGRPVFPGRYTDRPPYYPVMIPQEPNYWDWLLAGEAQLWSLIQRQGGIRAILTRLGRVHVQPLINARQIVQQSGAIALPAPGGFDTTVLTFTVPSGYNFEIASLLHFYTGNGFVEGSGDLSWRLMIGNRYAPTLGNMQTTVGSTATPVPIQPHALIAVSNDVLQYIVNVAPSAANNLAGGNIVCQIAGYLYPRD